MTVVEVLILSSTAGLAGGFVTRRLPAGRLVLAASSVVLTILIVLFGSEFIGDLL